MLNIPRPPSGFAALALAGSIALAPGQSGAQNTSYARLVLVGDTSGVLLGQDGYCGKMARVDGDALQQIKVAAGKTWLRRIVGGHYSGTCSLDISLDVEANQTYIVRYTDLRGACMVEAFRIQPDLEPKRQRLNREASRSCLLP